MARKYFEMIREPGVLQLSEELDKFLRGARLGDEWIVREVTTEVLKSKDLLKICGEVVKRLDAAQPIEPGTLLHANLCAAIEGADG